MRQWSSSGGSFSFSGCKESRGAGGSKESCEVRLHAASAGAAAGAQVHSSERIVRK